MNYEGEFHDKRVVVTGAAGIYGGWIAAAFAAQGAVLCLSDLRRDKLEETTARLGLDRATTLLHTTDLTDEKSIAGLADLVAKAWGAPDIVINNAGVYPRTGVLLNLDTAEFDRIMSVNVRAPFLVTRDMAQADDPREDPGRDRQHRLRRRAADADGLGHLLHVQDRAGAAVQGAGAGTGARAHPGERGRARLRARQRFFPAAAPSMSSE